MSTRRLALIEMLHPLGTACRTLVLGANCPSAWLPERPANPKEAVDLLLLAPAVFEYHNVAWRKEVCSVIGDRLERDGIVYLIAPPISRRMLAAALHAAGLIRQTWFIHMPRYGRTRYLLPLNVCVLTFVTSLLPPRLRQFISPLVQTLRIPGMTCAARWVLPSVALVAQRDEAHPLFWWLQSPDRAVEHVVLRTSWRGGQGSLIAFRLTPESRQPSLVAKLSVASDAEPVTSEARNLSRLGAIARSAGARVPQVLEVRSLCGHPVLLEQFVPGRSAAYLLGEDPRRFGEVVHALSEWLLRWNTYTQCSHRLNGDDFEAFWLRPARVVSNHLDAPHEYTSWLRKRLGSLKENVFLVSAHHDLTMWNVVVDGKQGIGVLDWEMASERALPLMDFYYAVCDAATALNRYVDRYDAFRACFLPAGRYAGIVRRLEQRVADALGVTAAFRPLCAHACWLRHAANETLAGQAGRQFTEILRHVARTSLDPSMELQ